MIAYVGIDAHTTNYTLSTYFEGSAVPVNTNTYSPAVANIVSYCNGIRKISSCIPGRCECTIGQ